MTGPTTRTPHGSLPPSKHRTTKSVHHARGRSVAQSWVHGASACASGASSAARTLMLWATFTTGFLGCIEGAVQLTSLADASPAKAERVEAVTHTRLAKPAPVLMVDVDGDGAMDIANPSHGELRGADAYGSGHFHASRDGGGRLHEGVDYVAAPGSFIRAPIAGAVTRIGYAYENDGVLRFVEITDARSGVSVRVFYVETSVVLGDAVTAGQTIGVAQDLSARYPGGMTNHVHVELVDASGVHVDPAQILPQGGTFHGPELAG